MIFIVNRNKKYALVCFLILLGILIISMYYLAAWEVKADKSNAVQVVKVAQPEVKAKIDFYTDYRLERDKIRSERSEILRESIKNAGSDEARRIAQENVLKMVQEKQREAEMESLIKAKGFSDALVFCRDQSVSAIIKTSELSQDEVIQVADVITRVTNVRQEDITIRAKP